MSIKLTQWRRRAGLALLACVAAVQLHASVPKEYQLKAAFLFNFTKFVKWTTENTDGSKPITIGVLGRDPFGDTFAQLLTGHRVNGREVVAKYVISAAEAAELNVLFVPAGEEARFDSLRASLPSASLLTVGESEEFAELGGMITFATEGGKIGFDINIEAARRGGVKVSADLQKLARPGRKSSR